MGLQNNFLKKHFNPNVSKPKMHYRVHKQHNTYCIGGGQGVVFHRWSLNPVGGVGEQLENSWRGRIATVWLELKIVCTESLYFLLRSLGVCMVLSFKKNCVR